jgi:cell division septation protein DedD
MMDSPPARIVRLRPEQASVAPLLEGEPQLPFGNDDSPADASPVDVRQADANTADVNTADDLREANHFTDADIHAILRKEQGGVSVADVCAAEGISVDTFAQWKAQHGGLTLSQMRSRRRSAEQWHRLLVAGGLVAAGVVAGLTGTLLIGRSVPAAPELSAAVAPATEPLVPDAFADKALATGGAAADLPVAEVAGAEVAGAEFAEANLSAGDLAETDLSNADASGGVRRVEAETTRAATVPAAASRAKSSASAVLAVPASSGSPLASDDRQKGAVQERARRPARTRARAHASGTPTASAHVVTSAPTGYAVQVTAARRAKDAQALAARLVSRGHRAYVMPINRAETVMYRVRVGPIESRPQADAVARQLEALGYRSPWVAREE